MESPVVVNLIAVFVSSPSFLDFLIKVVLFNLFSATPKNDNKAPVCIIFLQAFNLTVIQLSRGNKKGPSQSPECQTRVIEMLLSEYICKEMMEFQCKTLDMFPQCCAFYTCIVAYPSNVAWVGLVDQL